MELGTARQFQNKEKPMKLFTTIALVSLSLVASVTVAEARNSTKDFQMPGLKKDYQKIFYRFNCVDSSCGNWNIKG
jgi:hypothetical protein